MAHRMHLESIDFRQVIILVIQEAVERNTLMTLKEYVLGEEGRQKFRKERQFSMDPMEYLKVVKDVMSTNNRVGAIATALGADCGIVREGEFKFSFVLGATRADFDLDPITKHGSVVMRDRLDEIKEIESKADDYIKSLIAHR